MNRYIIKVNAFAQGEGKGSPVMFQWEMPIACPLEINDIKDLVFGIETVFDKEEQR